MPKKSLLTHRDSRVLMQAASLIAQRSIPTKEAADAIAQIFRVLDTNYHPKTAPTHFDARLAIYDFENTIKEHDHPLRAEESASIRAHARRVFSRRIVPKPFREIEWNEHNQPLGDNRKKIANMAARKARIAKLRREGRDTAAEETALENYLLALTD